MLDRVVHNHQFDPVLFFALMEERISQQKLVFAEEVKFVDIPSLLKPGWASAVRLLCKQIEYPRAVVNKNGEAKPAEVDALFKEAQALYTLLWNSYYKK